MRQFDDPRLVPSHFGRGWVPAGRNIGLPDDDLSLPAVAPAEGAGQPGSRVQDQAHRPDDGSDGPLPSQGRRDGEGGGWPPAAPAFAPALAHTGWTPERRLRFLDHLSEQGHVRGACARVGISPEAAYRLRRREPLFAAAWDAALVLARDHAEQVLACRAIEGVAEDIYYRGELVGTRVRHDARLLLAHLGRLDARATAPHAETRAARFDELLALAAGLAPPAELTAAAQAPDGARAWYAEDGDPLLPPARADFVADAGREAAEAARIVSAEAVAAALDEAGLEDEFDEEAEVEAAELAVEMAVAAAREAAGGRWDAWREDTYALADGIAGVAGEAAMDELFTEGFIAGDPAADDASAGGAEAGGETEYKSLSGAPGLSPLDPVNPVNRVSTLPRNQAASRTLYNQAGAIPRTTTPASVGLPFLR